MIVVFVHGWSVTSTDTYGGLPAALALRAPASLNLTTQQLYLGKYVSFSDEVKVDDIARGMQKALATEVIPKLKPGERFACITHSTGGPVVRTWVTLFFDGNLGACPMSHLLMLAPANHGSALAQLGKGRLARMKFFLAEGVQPGTGVLDWLELGSNESWELNRTWLGYDCVAAGLYPFVLSGQRIDRSLYDNLNSYTDEAGSDGVVRLAAANLNYGLVRLEQVGPELRLVKDLRTQRTAFGVVPGRSHSGDAMGILRSVRSDDDVAHPTLDAVLQCLGVTTQSQYVDVSNTLQALTATTQTREQKDPSTAFFIIPRTFLTSRYCMFVFRIVDDRQNVLADYDVIFTAGPTYDPNHLPEGFFIDRQRNQRNPGKLTYYIDYDVMRQWMTTPAVAGKFGFRIAARPDTGYAHYVVAEHRGTFADLAEYFEPNQTLMIEVQLKRHVFEGAFRLSTTLEPPEHFTSQPKGEEIR